MVHGLVEYCAWCDHGGSVDRQSSAHWPSLGRCFGLDYCGGCIGSPDPASEGSVLSRLTKRARLSTAKGQRVGSDVGGRVPVAALRQRDHSLDPAGDQHGQETRPTGVHQGLLRHSAAVKRTANVGEPNGRNTGEGDGAGGLVGAPPRSWRRQVRRRATCATLLGEAEAASSQPAAAGRAAGAAGTGTQRHGGAAVAMAGPGIAGRRGGAEGARARRPRRRDRAAEGEGRRDDHGDRAVAGEDCPPRGRRPFGTPEVEAMSHAVSPSVDRVYGLVRVTRCWNVSRAAVYRHRQAPIVPKRRPGPVGPCDDATLLEHIKKAIAESRFTGEGYRKIWARLRFSGVRSAPGRVRRLMRENGLAAPQRIRKRPDRAHDGTITTEAVDVLWGTDMTQSVTLAEGVAHVFVAVDHCNSECVGIHADKSANRFQALEPVRQGV